MGNPFEFKTVTATKGMKLRTHLICLIACALMTLGARVRFAQLLPEGVRFAAGAGASTEERTLVSFFFCMIDSL